MVIVLKQLSEQQRQTVHEAANALQIAEERAAGLRKLYTNLIGMAMPEGTTGFDLQAGTFYREEVESIEVPAGPQLVTDEEGPGSEEE